MVVRECLVKGVRELCFFLLRSLKNRSMALVLYCVRSYMVKWYYVHAHHSNILVVYYSLSLILHFLLLKSRHPHNACVVIYVCAHGRYLRMCLSESHQIGFTLSVYQEIFSFCVELIPLRTSISLLSPHLLFLALCLCVRWDLRSLFPIFAIYARVVFATYKQWATDSWK